MKAVKAKKLWNELMDTGKNPNNNDLRYVIGYVESLRSEAWQKLLNRNPSNNDLRYVIEYVKSLRFEARKMLKTPKRSMEEVMKDIRDL